MKKSLYVFLFVTVFLLFFCHTGTYAIEGTEAENIGSDISRQLEDIIDADVRKILREMGFSEFSFSEVYNTSFKNITEFFSTTLKDKLSHCLESFGTLLCIVMFSGILSCLTVKSGSEKIFMKLCCVITALSCIDIFRSSISAVVSVLNLSGSFMLGFIPIYTLIISLSGSPASALTYNSLVFAFAEFISGFISSVSVDIMGIFFCLSIAFTMNDSVNINKFLAFVNRCVNLILGLFTGTFTGLLGIKNLLAVSVDSVSVKSVRFLLSSLIPVVGSSISEAYFSLLGSINIIKGSCAVIGILVIIIINFPIICENLIYYCIFSILSYVAEGFSCKGSADILRCFSQGIRILMILTVLEMFILIISTGIMLSVKGAG